LEPCILIGVAESGAEAISVYPNPTTGALSLRLPASMTGVVSVQLAELNGRVVLTERINAVAGVPYRFNLNVNDGTYVLHVRTAAGSETMMPVLVSVGQSE